MKKIILAIVLFYAAVLWAKGNKPPVPDSLEKELSEYFNVDIELVNGLSAKGYRPDDLIRMLIVSHTTDMKIEEVDEKISKDISWIKICEEAGISCNRLDEEKDDIKKTLAEYINEGYEKETDDEAGEAEADKR